MDGRVVTYAQAFKRREGLFGPDWEPQGAFIISVSRNRIQIEHAHLDRELTLQGFKRTLDHAYKQFNYLQKTNGRPKDNWDGSPIKIHLKI